MLYTPRQFKGRIGYSIFVDRFCRGSFAQPIPIEGRILKEWNDPSPNWWPNEIGDYPNNYFYGGDLEGITQKLPYLKLVLGVDLLYISPISKTPSSHHYDVDDQRIIDPWIGTWEDYQTMCDEAHKLGMLVCQDLVFNHMGAYSSKFQEAVKNPNSHYHNWFEWGENGEPIFWYGIKEMPQCNKLNQEYQEYVLSVVETYLNAGTDGVRLDLGEHLPRELMYKIMAKAKSIKPEALIVSEMWDLATENGNRQIYDGEVHSVMNYPSGDAICRWLRYGNWKHLSYTMGEISKYPIEVQDVLWNFLDSHDNPRLPNLLSAPGMVQDPFQGRLWKMENNFMLPNGQCDTYAFRKFESDNEGKFDLNRAYELSKMASLMQYVIRGNPIVYYGTEAGLTGYKDPWNRKPYPWDNVNEDMLQHYSKIGRMRTENIDILTNGTLEVNGDDVEVEFIRRVEGAELRVIINRMKTIRECKCSRTNKIEIA